LGFRLAQPARAHDVAAGGAVAHVLEQGRLAESRLAAHTIAVATEEQPWADRARRRPAGVGGVLSEDLRRDLRTPACTSSRTHVISTY
jgi:hypothetical protein